MGHALPLLAGPYAFYLSRPSPPAVSLSSSTPLLGLLAVLVLIPSGWAQDEPSPNTETLTLDLSGLVPVRDPYEGLWAPSPGAAARVATPFYGGEALVGLSVHANESGGDDLPEFLALHAYGGWGYPMGLPGRLRLTPSAEVGALHMRFDDEDRFILALQNETELTAGLSVRLDTPVLGRLHAFAAVQALRVYTFERIDLGFVHVGLSTTVASPSWVRRLLR